MRSSSSPRLAFFQAAVPRSCEPKCERRCGMAEFPARNSSSKSSTIIVVMVVLLPVLLRCILPLLVLLDAALVVVMVLVVAGDGVGVTAIGW